MKTVEFMKIIEAHMDSELHPGVISYYDGEENGLVSYKLTYTERHLRLDQEKAAKQSIIEFAKCHNAVEISDNSLNVRITFRIPEMENITVMINGNEHLFDAVVNMMDDDIREALHSEGIEDPQAFVDAYISRHAEKYNGEQFDI